MKSDNPKISVIVPVYNTEKYLRRCIDSILNQTFTDFEVLLINDGSTDSSGAICDEYAKQDSRIRVFHKENGGVSSARNLGLDNILGEYVTFVDSDDMISLEALKLYIECHINNTSDIVVANYQQLNSDKTNSNFDVAVNCGKDEYLRKILLRETSFTLWAKSFKSCLFEKYRFINGCDFGEDFMMYPKLVYDANNVFKINKSLYTYYKDDVTSYTNVLFKISYIPQLYAIGENLVSHFYKKRNTKVDVIIEEFVGIYKVHMIFMAYQNKEAIRCILKTYKLNKSVDRIKITSKKYSVFYWLVERLDSHNLIFFIIKPLIILRRFLKS